MKTLITITLVLNVFLLNLRAQETNHYTKFNLTICTQTRNAKAVLLIKDSSENTFTGTLFIDNDERNVFGWYIEKKSEGDIHNYSTEGIAFYVVVKADFRHQQLFKAIYNFDKKFISGNYFYWGNEFIFYGNKVEIQSFDSTITNIEDGDNKLLDDYNLNQNYPNPFNPTTTINYQIPKAGNVIIKVFDCLGREVKELVNEFKNKGRHTIEFNASLLTSGIYYYRIRTNDYTSIKKMILLK